jgi:hypothetical protein
MWRMPNPTHVMPPSSWVMNANISWSGSVTHITSQIRRMCKGGQSTTNSRSSASPSPRLCSLTNGRLSTHARSPSMPSRAFEAIAELLL